MKGTTDRLAGGGRLRVEVIIKSDRTYVKKAMLATMGKKPKTKELSDTLFKQMLIAGDSPCKEYEFWINCYDVPNRVHTHVVRHERTGKYVATSRPDLDGGSEDIRDFSLKIDALRLIEICRLRLCIGKVWKDTLDLFTLIRERVIEAESLFSTLLSPVCVWYGFCPMGKKCCGYINSNRGLYLRNELVGKK